MTLPSADRFPRMIAWLAISVALAVITYGTMPMTPEPTRWGSFLSFVKQVNNVTAAGCPPRGYLRNGVTIYSQLQPDFWGRFRMVDFPNSLTRPEAGAATIVCPCIGRQPFTANTPRRGV